VGRSAGFYGGTTEHYVFEANGSCFGEISSWSIRDFHSSAEVSSKKRYDLPPETFAELRKILLESKFLSLKPGLHGFIFEGSASLSVEAEGRTHEISWGAVPVPECRPLCEFLDGLTARGKESAPITPSTASGTPANRPARASTGAPAPR
jgi:hypothetical protein